MGETAGDTRQAGLPSSTDGGASRRSSRRRRTDAHDAGAEQALDRLKYEVADELGLRDDIARRGWGEMTTREVGTIGGHMVRKMVRFAERRLQNQDGGAEGR